MLKPEIAKKQLEQWQITTEEEDSGVENTLLARAAKMPKPLRTVAYGLLERDSDGKELSSLNWQERQRRQDQTCAELDQWAASQRLRLFEFFFPKMAEQVEQGWQFLKTTPYTHGYTRKAFRAPNYPPTTLPKRRAWLTRLIDLVGRYRSDVLAPSWLAAWTPHLGESWRNPQDEVGQLLASVMDAGGPLGDEVFDIVAQSVRNEHEIGGMGRHVTRALLLSSRADGWELMEKTLLAAQRQEGLRQAILETIDEAHPQAFRRMLRLIQEHDLARFSAVVRAVNVWFGFSWDSVSTKTINAAIDRAVRFLDDETARKHTPLSPRRPSCSSIRRLSTGMSPPCICASSG
jgi:hypothetical protein